MKLDFKNMNLRTNHTLNILLLVGGAVIILYNHVAFTGGPLRFEEFLPLAPLVGSYMTALKAQDSHSTKWISIEQTICIMELAAERGRDAHQVSRDMFDKELSKLSRREASKVLSFLKEKSRPKGGEASA